ncbi:MAG: hypothetical protein D6791_06295 [Chloroflexi bacterium]|nr:MAG: hypothetical protein D6791_06295 [Chloroflexota bacterium]
MNPISQYLIDHMVAVYFLYGLTFFGMGLMVATTCRRGASEFRFAGAIRFLSLFGLSHGAHEWAVMFQMLAEQTTGRVAPIAEHIGRVGLLALSFLSLMAFGITLLSPRRPEWRRLLTLLATLTAVWLLSIAGVRAMLAPSAADLLEMADVLARYSLGAPAALLATWALMRQQRSFREQNLPRFGRFLVWAASAMLVYGLMGQLTVPATALFPSRIWNEGHFLAWFGVPVQLFRALVMVVFAYSLLRALDAFEVEQERRLEEARRAKVMAQQAQIEAERRNRLEMEQLNAELRLTTRELMLMLDLANTLVSPRPLEERLKAALEELIDNVPRCDNGMVLLVSPDSGEPEPVAAVGFSKDKGDWLFSEARQLGVRSVKAGMALCQRLDGVVLVFHPADEDERRRCESYPSPMIVLSVPLIVQDKTIGSLVFAWPPEQARAPLSMDEFRLVFAATQQFGLSIEHARLAKEALDREKLLAQLLHQVVEAQENERKRIARELHDATGQSLTALSLGLRGVEKFLEREGSTAVPQVHEMCVLSSQALGELRQIIADLRPSRLDDLGLVPAIRWYLDGYQERYGIPVRLETQGRDIRLPSRYEIVLFRIVQEALINIAKHANATQASVTLTIGPTSVRLEVADNGRGFDVRSTLRRDRDQAGWGLLGMQERVALLGGDVTFDSAPDQGTRITATIPLIQGEESS